MWHYAHGLTRIFPEIERECRDKVDFEPGFEAETGELHHRHMGGAKFGDAIEGNCGTILRVLRESQMSTDYTFLESLWDMVRLAMEHVIEKWIPDEGGMLAGARHNTLGQPWYGQVPWCINIYQAAVKASAVMALKELALDRVEETSASGVIAEIDGKAFDVTFAVDENLYPVRFDAGLNMEAGRKLNLKFT